MAVGDIHGDYQQARKFLSAPAHSFRSLSPRTHCNDPIVLGLLAQAVLVLKVAKLMGPDGGWIGGSAVLVQTGDIFDRGENSLAALALFEQLKVPLAFTPTRANQILGAHDPCKWTFCSWEALNTGNAFFASAGNCDRSRLDKPAATLYYFLGITSS